MITETNLLSDEALDAVAGGFCALPLLIVTKVVGSVPPKDSGPPNDGPAQMFQQLLQQLTQGGG
jgi:hypothetical protein